MDFAHVNNQETDLFGTGQEFRDLDDGILNLGDFAQALGAAGVAADMSYCSGDYLDNIRTKLPPYPDVADGRTYSARVDRDELEALYNGLVVSCRVSQISMRLAGRVGPAEEFSETAARADNLITDLKSARRGEY